MNSSSKIAQSSKDVKESAPQKTLDIVKQELIANVPILDVVSLYPVIEIPSNKRNRKNIVTNCPICGHRKCFRIETERNFWQCQSSGHTGMKGSNVIDLPVLMDELNFKDACKFLCEKFRPDLLPFFNGNGSTRKHVNPNTYRKVSEYWKTRGITTLPASVKIKKDNVVFYFTHTDPDKMELFQYSPIDSLKSRLAKTGKLKHELYVPLPWQTYTEQTELYKLDELYLVEGIPDVLTYHILGKRAIGAFNVGSVKRELFQQELKVFLEYVKPKTLVIVPDSDGFSLWKEELSALLKDDFSLEFVDLSLWLPEDGKIDSNDLFTLLGCNTSLFRQALTWVRQNSSTTFQGNVGKKHTIIKNYEKLGYFRTSTETDDTEETQPVRVTNFLMFLRHFSRDVETQEGKVTVTFQYDWNPNHRLTKVVDSRVLGDTTKFKELIASVKHTLFFNGLKQINFFEDKNYQHGKEIIAYEKFGHITDDLVLFKNVAIYKGKAYYADINGLITVNDACFQTLADHAPALTLQEDNKVNKKLVLTLHKAYGLTGVLSLAFDLASIRMKPIIDRLGSHPNKFCVGEFGIGKSKLEHEKNRLFGIVKSLTCKDTRASLERITATRQYLPATLNEFKLEHLDAADFLEKAYDRQIKNKAYTDNTNRTKDNAMHAIVSVTSNHVPAPSTALFRRNAYLRFSKEVFHKEHLNDLETLSRQSDIVLRTYTLKMDIETLHENACHAIRTVNEDATVINNYAPFVIGLEILCKLDAITRDWCDCWTEEFLCDVLPDTLTTITEETMSDSFLKDLHSKALHIIRERNGEFETEVNPGTHYAIRNNRLILDLGACVDIVNRGRSGNKFDRKVLEQALHDAPYFCEQPNYSRIAGKRKYKAIQLDTVQIQNELGLTFRESTLEIPENILLSGEEIEEKTDVL